MHEKHSRGFLNIGQILIAPWKCSWLFLGQLLKLTSWSLLSIPLMLWKSTKEHLFITFASPKYGISNNTLWHPSYGSYILQLDLTYLMVIQIGLRSRIGSNHNENPLRFPGSVPDFPPFVAKVNISCQLASYFEGLHFSCKVALF